MSSTFMPRISHVSTTFPIGIRSAFSSHLMTVDMLTPRPSATLAIETPFALRHSLSVSFKISPPSVCYNSLRFKYNTTMQIKVNHLCNIL